MAESKKGVIPFPIDNEFAALRVMANTLIGRAATAAMAGQSYGGERDLYKVLGYKADPKFTDYYNMYNRQDIARRIVRAAVNASWRKKPTIEENIKRGPGIRTEFEKAWDAMVQDLRLYHYLVRTDRISGIGEYGILFLGFDDGKSLDQEVSRASLMYLHPYHEGSLTIDKWEEDPKNPRYSLPLLYKVKMSLPGKAGASGSGEEKLVHWTRCLHVAEDTLENDVIGTPRLQPIYNRLQDLEKVVGGSAEMFWRGAFPGYGLKADPEYEFTTQDMENLEEEITKFVHDLQRYVRLVGVDVKELATQVADPKNHVDVIIQLISAATNIPKRVLTGSERGELASTMDDRNWNVFIETRQEDHNELLIIRPLISRLVEVNAMPPPSEEGYTVHWEALTAPSEKEEADVARLYSEALAKYATPGVANIMPWSAFLKRVMGFSEEEINRMEELLGQDKFDEEVAQAEAAEVRKRIEEEMRQAGWTPPQQLLTPQQQLPPGEGEEGEEE